MGPVCRIASGAFTLFIINPDYADKARSGRLNAAYIENRLPVG
ncbi:MAG: hypothetical protein ACLVJO_04205 [[Clostridium] scindens]